MKFLTTLCALLAVLAAFALPASADPNGTAGSIILNADANGDGAVTRAEFLSRRSAMFATLDTDHSGGLNQMEFTAFLGEKGSRLAGKAFQQIDTDSNGTISQAEWDASPARAFDRADKNDDGVLDAAEINAIRKRG